MSTFTEDFLSGLTPYTLISGNLGLFTIVTDGAQALNVASQNSGTVSAIRRTVPSITSPTRVFWDMKITAINSDDSAVILLNNNGTVGSRVGAIPARESFYDPLRRPIIIVNGTSYTALATALTLNVWYHVSIVWTGAAWICTMTDTSTDTIVFTQSGTGAMTVPNRLDFSADAGLPTIPTRFKQIVVSNDPESASMSPVYVFRQFFTNTMINGSPEVLANGKIYSYLASTSTPLDTYTNAADFTPNTNPILLDANGRIQTNIFLDDSKTYRLVLTNSTNTVVSELNNVSGINA